MYVYICEIKICASGSLKPGTFGFEQGDQNWKGCAAPLYVYLARTLFKSDKEVIVMGLDVLSWSRTGFTGHPISCEE